MLKVYAGERSVRLVGKAWEIRQALRQEAKRCDGVHADHLWSRIRNLAAPLYSSSAPPKTHS